jgi:hypothetical protein
VFGDVQPAQNLSEFAGREFRRSTGAVDHFRQAHLILLSLKPGLRLTVGQRATKIECGRLRRPHPKNIFALYKFAADV